MRVLILLALLGTAFAVPKSMPQRIVGGEATTIDQYPYMANMQYYWWIWWMQFCGGTVITADTIVSAAHCYDGDSPSSWRVILGTSLASSGGTQFGVSRIIMHERYNTPSLDNDVAIVKLSTPAVLSNVIQQASIAGLNYPLPDGATVTTIGWGALSSGGSSPEQLQSVDINVINQELCAERYAHLKTLPGFQGWPDITDGMLCAGILDIGGKDACQGDSGGPLVHGDVLVGIVSWGYGCADATYPGVNARVSTYSDWIVANAS